MFSCLSVDYKQLQKGTKADYGYKNCEVSPFSHCDSANGRQSNNTDWRTGLDWNRNWASGSDPT